MNVAHAIHGVGLGGAQKVIASIVRGRSRGEGDIRYFVYACLDGVRRREIEEAGATVRIIPRLLPKFDPVWAWRLGLAFSRDRIDVVHAHLFGDSLHSYLAARVFGRRPVVLTLHIGPEGWTGLQRPAYPWLLRHCQRAVACARSVEENVRATHPAAVRVMESIPNGIEIPPSTETNAEERGALRRSLGIGPDDVFIAAIGRLTEQKGYSHLVSAMARLRDAESCAGARLVFLGEGELLEALRAQAAAEGVADRIVFAGFQSEVAKLLETIDVVVLSSLYEGLPIALLEAMAAGRSLVVTDIPGNLDAVRAESEALVVPAGDSGALARALARLVRDAELRRRLGDAARARFLECFTAEQMVEGYERVYREVLEGRPGGS